MLPFKRLKQQRQDSGVCADTTKPRGAACCTAKPLMFTCPLFHEFRELNET